MYFINFKFSVVFFGTTGESHVDNRCQIKQPQKTIPCIHSENIFSTNSSRVSSLTVPQLHFPILNLQIPLRYLDINYSPSSISLCLLRLPKEEKVRSTTAASFISRYQSTGSLRQKEISVYVETIFYHYPT